MTKDKMPYFMGNSESPAAPRMVIIHSDNCLLICLDEHPGELVFKVFIGYLNFKPLCDCLKVNGGLLDAKFLVNPFGGELRIFRWRHATSSQIPQRLFRSRVGIERL